MGLITETDYQYYEGEQLFWADGNPGQDLVCTFNTDVMIIFKHFSVYHFLALWTFQPHSFSDIFFIERLYLFRFSAKPFNHFLLNPNYIK